MVAHLREVRDAEGYVFFHGVTQEKTTKAGWADTFQEIAQRLGLDLTYPNGARAYTGHSARVTGARHLASSQVELWRIQLFGRWGSEVFLHYIQDAPVSQLHLLSQESTAFKSIQVAKQEIFALMQRAQDIKVYRIKTC